MIFENHQIAYPNVVSKYYNFVPEEIELAIKDFDEILERHGYHSNGTLFFSIISDPTDEIMTAELFLSIKESNFHIDSEEQMYFRSYFNVKPMIMTRVMEDFDSVSQVKYWELMDYMKRHGMKQRTPIFVEFQMNHQGDSYVEMSVGI